MITYPIPVRMSTPEALQYTFKDQTGTVIDLTGYAFVALEIKTPGSTYITTTASFSVPKTAGIVTATGIKFDSPGTWNAQFIVYDPLGNKLPGVPIKLVVVENIEDLRQNVPAAL